MSGPRGILEHLWRKVQVGGKRLRRVLWAQVQSAYEEARTRAVRITLSTRILIVLLSIATASTTATVLLQDTVLQADLGAAAQARLSEARGIASQLLDEYLGQKRENYRTAVGTSELLANFETNHAATLQHYAQVLLADKGAAAIVFLSPEGEELALAGNAILGHKACDDIRPAPALDDGAPGRWEAMQTLFDHEDRAFALVSVPVGELVDGAGSLGTLVAVESVGQKELTSWSRLCRARVLIGVPDPDDPLSLPVRALGSLEFRVVSSFHAELGALANSRWSLLMGGLVGLALASAASVLLARSLVKPIRAIQSATERIGDGDLQFRLADSRTDEVGDVARGVNLMLDRLEQNISERLRVEDEINHLAHHDGLTGLANRRLMKERLAVALEGRETRDCRVAVMFLDLDRFKNVNDTLGHTAGDELLIEVSRRLGKCVRAVQDSGEHPEDTVLLARLGGDEFTIMLTEVRERSQLEVLAEQALRTLGEPFQLRGREVTVSASLGIALSSDEPVDAETLIRDADMAMYHAKSQGGKGFEFYADSMLEIAAKRLALESRLKRALEQDEFELHYQPKVDLKSNQVTGVEALLRWRSPEGGLIGPEEFIPMAEETGAIIPIGEWVLRKAVEQALAWQAQGIQPVRIAVNVSVRQIENRGDLVADVAELLAETGLDPRLLDLEITEGALLRDEEATIALLERFKSMGVGLSLDDFGTGYSSLSYLRRLPVDTLKIDRSFIQAADTNTEDAALVGSIVAMAKVLKLRVVVEGVETAKQRRFLEGLGCDEIQGFLYSEPVDAEHTAEILRKKRAPPILTGRRRRSPARTGRPIR